MINVLSYSAGDKIAVVCRPGYLIINDTSAVVCTSRGSWSRTLPTCVEWEG